MTTCTMTNTLDVNFSKNRNKHLGQFCSEQPVKVFSNCLTRSKGSNDLTINCVSQTNGLFSLMFIDVHAVTLVVSVQYITLFIDVNYVILLNDVHVVIKVIDVNAFTCDVLSSSGANYFQPIVRILSRRGGAMVTIKLLGVAVS